MTSATGVSPRDVHDFSRHSTRSDFVPNRSFPSRDSYGGYAWFSCLKKLSKSPWRVWVAMYNRENCVHLLFRDVMVCFVFDGHLDGGRLNKGIWFLLIGSNTGVVRFITRSVMYLYWSWPVFSISRTVWTIAGSATSLLSRTGRPSLSSMNGFLIIIFKYLNESTNLSGKFDLCRRSMLMVLEIGPGSFPCTSIQAIVLKLSNNPRKFRSPHHPTQ